jgi:parallel beta-helix repeat protein
MGFRQLLAAALVPLTLGCSDPFTPISASGRVTVNGQAYDITASVALATPTPTPEPEPEPSPVASPSPSPSLSPTPVAQVTKLVTVTGSASSDCAPERPCTLARAAQIAVPGDVVRVSAGVYGGAVVHGHASAGEPIVFEAESRAAVITGTILPRDWKGGDDTTATSGNHHVHWRGFTLRVPNGAAIGLSTGWRVEKNRFEGGVMGVNARGHRWAIVDNEFDGQSGHAMVGAGGSYGYIARNLIQNVNKDGSVVIGNSAVTKFLMTDQLVVEGNVSQRNRGPCFWLDYKNTNFVIRDNTFRGCYGKNFTWEGPGLWLEYGFTSNGVVENNRFLDNAGPGLELMESANVVVRNNHFEGNGLGCYNFRNMEDRAKLGSPVRDVQVTDNTCVARSGQGFGTTIGQWTDTPGAWGLLLDRNRYVLGSGVPLARWNGKTYATLEAVRKALGWEKAGSVD